MSDILRAHGNEQVVAELEKALEYAKKGRAAYVGIALMEHTTPLQYWYNHAGDSWLEKSMTEVLGQLIGKMREHIELRTLPPATLTEDHVAYNVPNGPLSFDFIVWLMNAEMNRMRAGAPAPLKVHFWHGNDGNPCLDDYRAKMYFNVVKPALKLIGAVEENQIGGHCEQVYCHRKMVDKAKEGHAVPHFSAPLEALQQMTQWAGYVTITLREAAHWTHRNSNLKAWIRFAKYLTSKGEKVVFVRDTAKAEEPLPFPICPQASRDIVLRGALYQVAKANLFVSNGPVTLAHFSKKPWFQILPLEEDGHVYNANTPIFWKENFGLEVGEQFPWSSDNQRLIWNKTDTYENLCEAWESINRQEAGNAVIDDGLRSTGAG